MVYFLSYLSLGMFMVVLKSPIRKLVDWEVADLKMHCLIEDKEVPANKLIVLRLILSFIIVAIYPIILYRKFVYYYEKLKLNAALSGQQIESEPAWLHNEISKENAEATNMVKIHGNKVPFGYNNDQWLIILKIMEKGDKLYEFRSPEESWRNYAGIEGIALVRNGEIVADLVILLN